MLCFILVGLSPDVVVRNNDSSAFSSSTVLAFPLSTLSTPPISTTRIRSLQDDNSIEAIVRTKATADLQKSNVMQRTPQEHHRRTFFGQVATVATASMGPVSSLAIPEPSYAATSTAKNTAEAIKGSEASMYFRKAKGGGLANSIRVGLRFKMDELQRDLMQERWDLLQPYPSQLRSYVNVFTTYTDAAFPSDTLIDRDLRVALRYEVGRFYGSVERLKKAIAKQELDKAYAAYADMSLHFDRYLHTGGLYPYYESSVDNEDFFKGYNDALVYSDPIKDPAEIRDLVVLCKGPDKGKTGILIGIYAPTESANDCIVKLDEYRGMREILVVPRSWAAKRLGEQAPDAVFLIPRK